MGGFEVGDRVIWLEDNTPAKIVNVVDRWAGVFELEDNDGNRWTGFDLDFVRDER